MLQNKFKIRYTFGMLMPNRAIDSEKYRWGFNDKENDNELKGIGNQQDYGMRIYDPRISKFLSVDPITKDFPWITPYAFAENDVLRAIDLDGMEVHYIVNENFSNGTTLTNTLDVPGPNDIVRVVEINNQYATGALPENYSKKPVFIREVNKPNLNYPKAVFSIAYKPVTLIETSPALPNPTERTPLAEAKSTLSKGSPPRTSEFGFKPYKAGTNLIFDGINATISSSTGLAGRPSDPLSSPGALVPSFQAQLEKIANQVASSPEIKSINLTLTYAINPEGMTPEQISNIRSSAIIATNNMSNILSKSGAKVNISAVPVVEKNNCSSCGTQIQLSK